MKRKKILRLIAYAVASAVLFFAGTWSFLRMVPRESREDLYFAQAHQGEIASAMAEDFRSGGAVASGPIYDGLLNEVRLRKVIRDPAVADKLIRIFEKKWRKNLEGNYVTRSKKLVCLNIVYGASRSSVSFSFYKSYDDYRGSKVYQQGEVGYVNY